MPKLDLNFYLKFEAGTLNHQFSQTIYLKLHICNYYPQFLQFRNKRIYVSVPDKNLKGMMKKNLCSSSTIHLIIKKFQTRLTKDIKGRGGVQVIIWYIKDKYLPSKSSKLAQTTWHSLHTMKNRVKWVMEFLFTMFIRFCTKIG